VQGKDPSKYAVYFGDIKANLYKLDARSGKLIWKVKIEDNPVARITGSPTLYRDRLYVPVASIEEWVAGLGVNYPCCTFRGSVVAVDAGTGKQIWKTYVIPDQPKLAGKTANGAQRWAPAGGGVWDSPTIDAQAHAVYIGTGDSYTSPAANTTDAVMALDMDTGKVIWSVQDTGGDAWLYACRAGYAGGNCPARLGPDVDFGSSPILKALPDGRKIVIAGQKSGVVWAHDASRRGAVVWKTQLADTPSAGEITFGGAADDQAAYFGLKDGGVTAIDLATGGKKWFATEDDTHNSTHVRGQTAAISGIPGVVFSGGWDGVLRAYSTHNGQRLWEYDTVREFKTVNGVAAKGGSMAGPGPVVVGGMLFVGSGYVVGASVRGNVLLAFAP
jgi:polyvinyl alcohol dehydrogenase (cytochrome)